MPYFKNESILLRLLAFTCTRKREQTTRTNYTISRILYEYKPAQTSRAPLCDELTPGVDLWDSENQRKIHPHLAPQHHSSYWNLTSAAHVNSGTKITQLTTNLPSHLPYQVETSLYPLISDCVLRGMRHFQYEGVPSVINKTFSAFLAWETKNFQSLQSFVYLYFFLSIP